MGEVACQVAGQAATCRQVQVRGSSPLQTNGKRRQIHITPVNMTFTRHSSTALMVDMAGQIKPGLQIPVTALARPARRQLDLGAVPAEGRRVIINCMEP